MNAKNVQPGRMDDDWSPCHQQIASSEAWFSLAIPGIVQERADSFTFQSIYFGAVARAFSQQYGIDYDKTFSPVAKMTIVRVLISLATSKSWRLWQMDVKNSFLYTVPLPSVFPAFTPHKWNSTFNQTNQPFIPHSKPSPKSPASLNASFPDLRLALKKKWRASSRSWVGWLSLTYPFLFPALLHFYSKKGAFLIYKKEDRLGGCKVYFTIRKEFSLILERAIEQAYAFFRFFIQFEKVLHNE